MRFRALALVTGALAVAAITVARLTPAQAEIQGPVVTVYKSPTCGCCSKWVEHMKANGFEVRAVDLDDLTEVKQASGVPIPLRTCHTAIVGDYVIEGHVPADLVKKMLADKPNAAGLAVPGMPMGSPGMEGTPRQSYDVLLFQKDGKTTVFAKR